MNIRLSATKAVIVELLPLDGQEDSDNSHEFAFDFNPVQSETDDKGFLIVFVGEMINPSEGFRCHVVFSAEFVTDEIISADLLIDPFVLVNAPAIAYPYFRAFYSNLLLNAGYKPAILPTINFVKLKEDKKREIEKNNYTPH